MPNIHQCQIELRVPKSRFEEALKYYANMFKLPKFEHSNDSRILVPGELAVLANAEMGGGGEYAVVVRGMTEAFNPGAVAHWGWVEQGPGGKLDIRQELEYSSRRTIKIDEETKELVQGKVLERVGGLDSYLNRVSSINPDFPGFLPGYGGKRSSTWGTVLGLLGLGIAGALVWRGASSR